MYFRLYPDEVRHFRVVFSIMDWLGAVGGIAEVLRNFVNFFLGGYLSFHVLIELLSELYSDQLGHQAHEIIDS